MLSASKLWKSSSTSGPSATLKPARRKIVSMRRRVRVTGCRPPTDWPRPGSVTSIAPLASSRSSTAASSVARRASSAAVMRALASLMTAPAALRSPAGRLPRVFSNPVIEPLRPSAVTRMASSAARSALAPISPSVPATSDSRSFTRPPEIALLRGQCGLRLLRDRAERRDVVHGDVGERLAVDLDAGRLDAGDEPAVREPEAAGSRIDALDPQRAVVALLQPPTHVRVLAGLDDRLLGDAVDLAPGVVVALRLLEDLLVPAPRDDTTFHSCHFTSLVSVATGIRRAAAAARAGRRRSRGPSSRRAAGACASSSSW